MGEEVSSLEIGEIADPLKIAEDRLDKGNKDWITKLQKEGRKQKKGKTCYRNSLRKTQEKIPERES